jgi:hypothetical protein
MIEHIVEHAMPLRTQRLPIFRIERFGAVGWLILWRQRWRIAPPDCHAARSRLSRARVRSIRANASKIICMCGGL